MSSFYVSRPRRSRRQQNIGTSNWPKYVNHPSGEFELTFQILEDTDRKKYPKLSTRRKLCVPEFYSYNYENGEETPRGGYHTSLNFVINLRTKKTRLDSWSGFSKENGCLEEDIGDKILLKTSFPDARYFIFAESFFPTVRAQIFDELFLIFKPSFVTNGILSVKDLKFVNKHFSDMPNEMMQNSYRHMRCLTEDLGFTLQDAIDVYDFFGSFILLGEKYHVNHVSELTSYIAAQVWEAEIIVQSLQENADLLTLLWKLVDDYIYFYNTSWGTEYTLAQENLLIEYEKQVIVQTILTSSDVDNLDVGSVGVSAVSHL